MFYLKFCAARFNLLLCKGQGQLTIDLNPALLLLLQKSELNLIELTMVRQSTSDGI